MSQEFQRLEPNDSRAIFAAQVIERLRSKLLDLTNKNPLLNFSHRDRARAQIRVIEEQPNFLFERIAEGSSLTFRALKELNSEPKDEKTDDFQMALDSARLEDKEYLEGIDAIVNDDPSDPSFMRIERNLKDRVRKTLGLPPRQTTESLSLADLARAQGINPSYDLPGESVTREDHHDDEIRLFYYQNEWRRSFQLWWMVPDEVWKKRVSVHFCGLWIP